LFIFLFAIFKKRRHKFEHPSLSFYYFNHIRVFYVKINNEYVRIVVEEIVEPIKWSVIDMKILGISVLMMGCLIGFSLGIDIIQGFDVSQALYNAISPFRVMELAELFVLFFLLFLFFAESLYLFMKKKNQSK